MKILATTYFARGRRLRCWLPPALAANAARGRVTRRTNLVSNVSHNTSSHNRFPPLKNPWGIAFLSGTKSVFGVNDNGSGLSALYNGDGTIFSCNCRA